MRSFGERVCRQQYANKCQKLCRTTRRSTPIQQCCFTARAQHNHERKNADRPEDGSVNFYEQDAVSLPGKGGFRLVGAPRNIQERVKQLERELQLLRQSNHPKDEALHELSTRGTEEHSTASWPPTIPDEDGLLSSAGQDNPIADSANKAAAWSEESVEVDIRLPDNQAKNIKRLNDTLQTAKQNPSSSRITRLLWQRYNSCKREVPGIILQLPTAAWRLLWASQYENKILNEARSKHLWILAEDMSEAGQLLSETQQMARIESRFAAGQYQSAIALWNSAPISLSTHPQFLDDFWSLGANIYIRLDEFEKAIGLASRVVRDYASATVSSFIPIIEGFLELGDQKNIEKAAATYFRARVALSDRFSLQDFDRVIMCFLRGGQPNLAAGIFKDMILAKCGSSQELDSLFQRSLELPTNDRGSAMEAAIQANYAALSILQHLPRRFENRYFYASWLKRLIGHDELVAAQQVLELMHYRGIKPDAKHLNGFISALLRRGTPKSNEFALQLGKSMIQSRLMFVAARNAEHTSGDLLPAHLDPPTELPPYLQAPPPATIETFSILLLYYENSNMQSSMAHLQSTLHLAELGPNIFFVNHLLHGHLRAMNFKSAWELYCMSAENKLRPDMDTFAILWDLCKAHVELHSPGASQKFPSPRSLFGYMTAWLADLPSKEAAAARLSITPKSYLQIIRSFCLARDLRGTLVALYSLRDMFGAYPDSRSARLIILLIARLGEPTTSQRIKLHDGTVTRRRRSAKLREQANQANFDSIAQVLETLKTDRETELKSEGLQLEDLNDLQKGEELLWLLGRLLKDCLDLRAQHVAEFGGQKHESELLSNSETSELEENVSVDGRLQEVAFQMGGSCFRMLPPSHQSP